MNKGKSGVRAVAGQTGLVVGRAVLGGLCGVGLLWAVTAFWPPGRSYVVHFGQQLETFTRAYPVAMSGLLLGVMAALVWQALRKPSGG